MRIRVSSHLSGELHGNKAHFPYSNFCSNQAYLRYNIYKVRVGCHFHLDDKGYCLRIFSAFDYSVESVVGACLLTDAVIT